MVLAERQTPSRVLHLLLSVVTAGIWLPVWVVIEVVAPGSYQCPRCGAKAVHPPRGFKPGIAKRL